MTLPLNIVVLALGAIQSLLVGLALLRQKRSHPSRIYLVLFLLVIGLQLAFKIISKTWLWEHARTIYMVSYNYGYLIGPLIYLLFRSRYQHTLFTRTDILHFVPFLATTILTLADELFGVIMPRVLYVIPWPSWQILSMLGYGYASWRLTNNEPGESKSLKRQFIIWALTIEIVIVITIAILIRNFQWLPDIRLLFMALTFLTYLVSYRLFSSPGIFTVDNGKAVMKLSVLTTSKYAKSGLDASYKFRILEKLKRSMEQGQIFLEHDLSLEDVARRLEVRKHHLSQAINEHYHKSFTELILTLRLEEAQTKIRAHANDDYKIAAIAFDAGFRSVSSFTTIFKKRFGVTPSEFRRLEFMKQQGMS